jgi:hypothetical protein
MAEAPATRTAAVATAQRAAEARPKREREQELLVWPDLVFVEFISAVVFTVVLIALSTLVNAPLLDRANPTVTPNPSKAPWYFLNLQELLLHMHPALAGVVVPTIWLIVLAAFPYFDQSSEAQGVWFGTRNAVRITVFATLFSTIGTTALVLFDSGFIESFTGWFPCMNGQGIFGLQAFKTTCTFSVAGYTWPQDFTKIGLGPISNMQPIFTPLGLKAPFEFISIPAIAFEQIVPTLVMTVLPVMHSIVLWKLGWAKTRRDHLIGLFTGFIVAFFVLTIIGTGFRGRGMEIEPPGAVIQESYDAAQGEIP